MYYADASKAEAELGFRCAYGLAEMARDSVNFALKTKNRGGNI